MRAEAAILHLAGMALWTKPVSSPDMPAAALLNPRTRGRASLLTLMFAEVVEQAATQAHLELGGFATVFGSAFGEMERLMQLLEGMHGTPSDVSPLRFQTSVHNAAAGQISIASKNAHFSTSVAAGRNTVAMGFVEAAAWVNSHPMPLVLALGDEGPPPHLHAGDAYAPLAAAFAFVPANQAPPESARLRITRRHADDPQWPLGDNPCAVLQPLTRWLASHTKGVFSLSAVGNSAYCIERL